MQSETLLLGPSLVKSHKPWQGQESLVESHTRRPVEFELLILTTTGPGSNSGSGATRLGGGEEGIGGCVHRGDSEAERVKEREKGIEGGAPPLAR